MKKIIRTILLLCSLLLFVSSCSNENRVSKNSIQSTPLSTEQKEIVDLLDTEKNEIQIFSYESDEQYKSIDVWVEIYKDGKLINDNAGGISLRPMENTKSSGKIALIINKLPDFQWTFIHSSNGSKVSATSEPCIDYKDGYAYGAMGNPAAIEDGKEIILYTALFSNSDGIIRAAGNEQDFVKQPELLAEYSFAHIIKCKFTR